MQPLCIRPQLQGSLNAVTSLLTSTAPIESKGKLAQSNGWASIVTRKQFKLFRRKERCFFTRSGFHTVGRTPCNRNSQFLHPVGYLLWSRLGLGDAVTNK